MVLKSKKPVVRTWFVYVCSILYIVVLPLFLYGFLCHNLICFLSGLVIFLILFASAYVFSWYESAKLEYSSDKFTYRVYEVVTTLGNNVSEYEIKNITNVKRKGKHCKVWGSIRYKQSFGKPKMLKSVKILDITDEAYDLLVKEGLGDDYWSSRKMKVIRRGGDLIPSYKERSYKDDFSSNWKN